MSSVLLYASDDAPKGASPTIIPRRFCRLAMLISRFLLLLMMMTGELLVQDGGLHLLAGATSESAGSFFGGVLDMALGEVDAHCDCLQFDEALYVLL